MKTERPSEIQTAFDIEFCWYMTQAAFASDGLRHGLESFGSNKNRVRAYRTHTLHLNLKVCVARSGRVRGVATHAADRGAGYGLLLAIYWIFCGYSFCTTSARCLRWFYRLRSTGQCDRLPFG